MAEFIINLGQAFKEIFSRCIDFPKSVWIYLVFFQGNVRKFICWYSLYSNIIQFWSKLLIFRVQLIWKVWKGISCCLIKIRQLPDRSGTCQIKIRQQPDRSGCCLIKIRQLPDRSGTCQIKIRRQPDWSGCCLIKIRQLPDRSGPWFVRSLQKIATLIQGYI